MMTKRIMVSHAVRIIGYSTVTALVAYVITYLLARNFWLSIVALFVAGSEAEMTALKLHHFSKSGVELRENDE